ncbi:MAG: adenylyl-sulfate kinase [Rhodocyclaceae bacterium]|nr:adenylyl-sulfate kinase [Rhodocyclaceae bacterium]MBL0074808.1 adenylyl-sulfate kinase [Rhodocyclaceae bacterium]
MAQSEVVISDCKPATFWMTGLPGSGKSTLATALTNNLLASGMRCCVLDGDVMRQGLCRDLGFSAEDRRENIRRVAEVARLLNDAGVIVVTALISPAQEDRAMAKEIIGQQDFVEVHVATPLAVCEARDPKGLYKRARSGQLANLTGVGSVYEVPLAPALAINTDEVAIEDAVARMLAVISKRG